MQSNLRRFSLICIALAAATALIAFAGYVTEIPGLTSVFDGFRGMSVPTAALIFLLAASIAAATADRFQVSRKMALGAAVLALVVLASHAIFGSDRLSEPVQHALFGPSTAGYGRTSVVTAVCAVLIAASAWLRRSRPALADTSAAAAAAMAAMALLSYAYGVDELYRIPGFSTMALNTAISLMLLSLAVVTCDPAVGWAEVIAYRARQGEAQLRKPLAIACVAAGVGYVIAKAAGTGLLGPAATVAALVAALAAAIAWLALGDGRARMQLDIERRRRAEMQAEQAAELERRLAQKVVEMEALLGERAKVEEIAQRAQRMEAVGRLTGGIAHDFNNLLQAVSGNLAILRRGLRKDDKHQRFVDSADKAVRKGAKLTGQLMAFSRSQRLSIRPVLVRVAVQDACELMRHSLGPGVSLVCDELEDELWAMGDAQQLELALMNLAMNARDAMPSGGVVRVWARPADPLPGKEGRFISACVSDTGEGMPPEVAKRAGEPFFTTKPLGKGTGLGLAQVFGFAKQCGGDVRILTAPGQGTTIEIVLPAADRTAELQAPSAVPAAPLAGGAGRRVALIDDDENVRSALARTLAEAGFEVDEAADGASGFAMMELKPPEVAVIDFMMPGLNGAEVARRAQAVRPGLPIVFISGYSETLALDRIACASVLRKPFDDDALLNAVVKALD